MGGFSAWFVYFLTKRAAKNATHFDGQAACNQMLKSLEEMPSEGRKLVAKQVVPAIPSVIQTRFQEVCEKTVNPNQNDLVVAPQKRRRE
jgi:hypothetical protein